LKKRSPLGLNLDLEELARDKERNRQDRLEFIVAYAKHQNSTTDEKWGKAHADFLNAQYTGLRKAKEGKK